MSRSSVSPLYLAETRWTVGVVCVLVLVVMGGCGQSTFLGRQYSNFTAYYNKFHNAEQAFEEGIQSLEEASRPVNRTQYLSVFLKPQQSGGGNNSSFGQAIQKSADVLREHPESKWVDDALLLIGKSYFYENNFIGAAQKFREAIALETDRSREARFWLARTLVTNEQYAAADEVLRTLERANATSDDRWTAQLYLVRGELLVKQQEWEAAASALREGLNGDLPDSPAARAAFLLGQVYETVDAPGQARGAYRRVQQYDPSYNLGFAARLSDIELQGEYGEPEEALDRLERLESDDKNYEKRGEMALVRARIYRAQEEYAQARKTLRGMLYGEEAPSGTAEGRLHYDLALLYRDAYKDFSRAAAHFDTASTGLRQPSAQGESDVQRLPRAPVDAGAQASRFRDLADRAREVARMDSLLRIGRLSDDEFRNFVQELRRKQQKAQEARQEAQQQAAESRRFERRGRALAEQRRTTASAADTRESDAGFLFYKDPTRVQQGKQQFQETWGDRPRVDNWRRRNAIRSSNAPPTATAPGDEESEAAGGTAQGGAPGRRGSSLDLSDIPRDSSSQATMEAERAVARYEFANSLFLAAGRPDSAATWYRRILQQNGDHPVAKRALYALAEAYRAQGDTTAAQQSYLRLIDQYPSTRLAERARERLDRGRASPADERVARADTAYAYAYQRWQEGEWRPALDSLLSIAGRHPDTDTAPRALLASGIIYWQRTQVDSASVPRRLLGRHLRALVHPPSDTSASRSMGGEAPGGAQRDSTGSRRSVKDSTLTIRNQNQAPRAATDSSLLADTAQVVLAEGRPASDSLGEPSTNSRQLPPDSTNQLVSSGDSVSPATSPTRGASAAGKSDVYGPLKSLLNHLLDTYSDAPQAERANVLLSMIQEQQAPADTTAVDSVAADTISSDSETQASRSEGEPEATSERLSTPAPQDSIRRSDEPPDSSRRVNNPASAERSALPAPSDPRASVGARDTLDRSASQGQWTLLIDRFETSQKASARMEELREQLGSDWPLEVVSPSGDSQQQLLIVGRFSSRQTAAEARSQLQEQINTSIRVLRRPRDQN